MLVIGQKVGNQFLLRYPGGEIWVHLRKITANGAEIGITAPKKVQVFREEILPPEERWQKDVPSA